MRDSRLSEANDRELADAIVGAGDELAFRELYGRHTPVLFQFVLRMLGEPEVEAEDVVQETWIRAVQQLDRFRWESRLSTWLIGIGANLCRDRLRRRTRRGTVGLDEVAPPTARTAGSPEDRIDLERAIALLPDGYRTVLLLHDVEGLTHGEIGVRLGIAEGTSKSQLFFARKTMRQLLTKAPQEESNAGIG
jgi:RNA polymerase sigma-70 factor (ECF subfamily)